MERDLDRAFQPILRRNGLSALEVGSHFLQIPSSAPPSLKADGGLNRRSVMHSSAEQLDRIGRQQVLRQRDKIVVLYIAGWGRSGSTIMGNILGQLPGFAHVGEISNVWTRGVLENTPCGCGTPFSECATWSRVFGRAFGGVDVEHARRMMALSLRQPNNKTLLLRAAVGRAIALDDGDTGAREYKDNLRRLYGSIVSEMDANVIVDSSKVPSYAVALASLPNVDVRVVHLVRDPRATSYSWSRHIDRSDAGRPLTMERLDTWESAARWCSWNATTELLPKLLARPTVRVSYEAFVRDPKATLSTVLELVADVSPVDPRTLPFTSDREVALTPTHNVWGNHRRRRAGRVLIESDEEWKANLSLFERAMVTTLTYPLARRYGY